MSRKCVECGKADVKITYVSDCGMEVCCPMCGAEYTVEPDGFGEGGLEWAEAMAEQEMKLGY